MKILIQFPEGLKDKVFDYAKKLEEEGNEVYIDAHPTFGACDLAIEEAKTLKVDKLIHFGHAEYGHDRLPKDLGFEVEYNEYKIEAPLNLLPKSLDYLKDYGVIGLVTTVQHQHQLSEIKEFYEKNGKSIMIGKPYGLARKEGQVLGCDVGSATTIDKSVDAFVYFGGGVFHPLGAVIATTKPFLIIDPFNGEVKFIDYMREQYSKRRKGLIMSSINAKKFGLLVSTKNGQYNKALADLLKKKIESSGLQAEILITNTFDFGSIDNMIDIDAFVNTACPRIAIDDVDRIRKPLLDANELMEVLKIKEDSAKLKEIAESGSRS